MKVIAHRFVLQFSVLLKLSRTVEMRIPAKPIADSDLRAITIPNDADRRRSEGTLSCSYHAEAIAILSILFLSAEFELR
jgi:hypothetical protein